MRLLALFLRGVKSQSSLKCCTPDKLNALYTYFSNIILLCLFMTLNLYYLVHQLYFSLPYSNFLLCLCICHFFVFKKIHHTCRLLSVCMVVELATIFRLRLLMSWTLGRVSMIVLPSLLYLTSVRRLLPFLAHHLSINPRVTGCSAVTRSSNEFLHKKYTERGMGRLYG